MNRSLTLLFVVVAWALVAAPAVAQTTVADAVAVDEAPSLRGLRLVSGLDLRRHATELDVRWLDTDQTDRRPQWGNALSLGVSYATPRLGRRALASSDVVVGIAHGQGHWTVGVRQRLLAEFPLSSAVSVLAGGAIAAHLNVGSTAYSYAELGPDVALGIRGFELGYQLGTTLPLGAERTDVLDGRALRRTALGGLSHTLSVRMSFGVGSGSRDSR